MRVAVSNTAYVHVFTIVQTITSDTLDIKVTRLPNKLGACHPPLSVESPASRRKMRVLCEAVLVRGDWQSLCDKLAISNAYSHAKNRNDIRPITSSKVPFPEVGFSAVVILGGGWLQSPASDGPPCLQWHLNQNTHIFVQEKELVVPQILKQNYHFEEAICKCIFLK